MTLGNHGGRLKGELNTQPQTRPVGGISHAWEGKIKPGFSTRFPLSLLSLFTTVTHTRFITLKLTECFYRKKLKLSFSSNYFTSKQM